MKKKCVFLPFCYLFFFASAQSDKIDNYIKSEMSKRHIPGLSLAVVKNGKIIKTKGYGLANIELNVPAEPKTVYAIASMTKQFTAVAIMLLVQDGKLSLTDKIIKYIPNAPASWSNTTLQHLLTHTSGIKDRGEDNTDTCKWKVLKQEIATGEKVYNCQLNFQSGEKMQYCNLGYYFLGLVIEKVSGKTYSDFIQNRIFHPLLMNATQLNVLSKIISNRASGYELEKDYFINRPPDIPYADGGLVSTVLDLAKWDAMFYTETLLKKSSLKQIFTPAVLNNGKIAINDFLIDSLLKDNYGFGWFLGEMKGHKYVQHAGVMSVFTSIIFRFPDDKLTVIVLVNRGSDKPLTADAPRPWDIAKGIANFYLKPSAPVMFPTTRKSLTYSRL